jgi:hypothetical protein
MSDAMARTASLLQAIAGGVDKILQTNAGEPMGFSIIVWPRTENERCNYVSNCDRAEVVRGLRALLAGWEASPEEVPGSHRVN